MSDKYADGLQYEHKEPASKDSGPTLPRQRPRGRTTDEQVADAARQLDQIRQRNRYAVRALGLQDSEESMGVETFDATPFTQSKGATSALDSAARLLQLQQELNKQRALMEEQRGIITKMQSRGIDLVDDVHDEEKSGKTVAQLFALMHKDEADQGGVTDGMLAVAQANSNAARATDDYRRLKWNATHPVSVDPVITDALLLCLRPYTRSTNDRQNFALAEERYKRFLTSYGRRTDHGLNVFWFTWNVTVEATGDFATWRDDTILASIGDALLRYHEALQSFFLKCAQDGTNLSAVHRYMSPITSDKDADTQVLMLVGSGECSGADPLSTLTQKWMTPVGLRTISALKGEIAKFFSKQNVRHRDMHNFQFSWLISDEVVVPLLIEYVAAYAAREGAARGTHFLPAVVIQRLRDQCDALSVQLGAVFNYNSGVKTMLV